ncbi:MAG: hypothetical protein LUQ65_06345 [Candidatus Helarchaeota archaeon]|nr:hypothetical protein [Candidatus Helarchaeota archaeon]
MDETLGIKQKTKSGPLVEVVFHRFQWSYVIAAILLLALTIFNYPFTSRQGEPFRFRFFLDFELLSGLDPHRNLITVLGPVPLYLVVGVLPGIFGLSLLIYTLLSGFPNKLYLGAEDGELLDATLFFRTRSQFPLKGLQVSEVGKRRLGPLGWFFFLGVSFWAFYLLAYIFDPLKNTGSLFYFGVFQDIWDGNQVIGQINLGVQLLITAIILLIAPIISVIFSRRECHIETDEAMIRFIFSSMTVKLLDESESWKKVPLAFFFKSTEEKRPIKNSMMPAGKNDGSLDSVLNSIPISLGSYFPKLKMFLCVISIVFLTLIEFLPHFFLRTFTVPFTNIGLCITLYFMLNLMNNESFKTQKLLQTDRHLFIHRSNRISGATGILVANPKEVRATFPPRRPALIEYLIAPLFLLEIFIVLGTVINYGYYFINAPFLPLQLLIALILLISILILYLYPINNLVVIPESQRKFVTAPMEQYSIFWPTADYTTLNSLKKIVSNLKLVLRDAPTRKRFLELLLLFGIPVLLFITWLLGVWVIRLLV